MKLGVFLPNWIGDAVMATPALRAIRERFRDAEIVGIARPYVSEVLAGLDLLDRLQLYEPKSADTELSQSSLVSRLKAEELDAVLLLTNSLRTAWLAWRSGAKRRIGFARDGRGWLLTDRLKPKSRKTPHPVIDEYNRLAVALGCDSPTRRTELATTPEHEQTYESYWADHDWRLRAAGIVGFNPGGAFGAAKHWPVEHFAELARRIADELGMTVLVLCGPNERDQAREIVRLAERENVLSLADGPVGIGVTKAAVKEARLLVTTDSGPRHFAQPFGVPVVTLFGPTHVAWSETFFEHAVHLQLEVDCGPCQQRTCPLEHHRCMRELTPATVFDAVTNLLESSERRAA